MSAAAVYGGAQWEAHAARYNGAELGSISEVERAMIDAAAERLAWSLREWVPSTGWRVPAIAWAPREDAGVVRLPSVAEVRELGSIAGRGRIIPAPHSFGAATAEDAERRARAVAR